MTASRWNWKNTKLTFIEFIVRTTVTVQLKLLAWQLVGHLTKLILTCGADDLRMITQTTIQYTSNHY